jgi:adenine phosphoribosyltransferase
MDAVRARIRDVPDFPKKGIIFKDITPVLEDAPMFRSVIRAMAEGWRSRGIDKVAGIESRGFIFGAALAYELGAGFVVIRKLGKLPCRTIQEEYALEYGVATLELHVDAISPGQRILVVDDLLATGGTAEAAGKLVTRQQGKLAGYAFMVELGFLKGASRLGPEQVHALVRYP